MLTLPWAAPCAAAAPSGAAPATNPTTSSDPAGRTLPRPTGDLESRPVGRNTDDGTSGGWGRTLGALAVVAVLIFAARWVLRRWGAAGPTGLKGPMEVLARASVAPRQQLVLVRLGKRLVLIGSGGGAMSTLAEVSDPAEVEELMASIKAGRGAGLGGLLSRYASKGEKKV